MKISKDRVVTIEYKMVDERGEVIDSTDDGTPLSFIQGRADVLPAIEKQLEGLQTGERITFTLDPAEGYGERDESKVQTIPRSQFKADDKLRIGMQFFTRKNGHDLPVTITSTDDNSVTVDGNHPLAGTSINIDLVIVDVRDAIEAELVSGEIQSDEEIFRQQKVP